MKSSHAACAHRHICNAKIAIKHSPRAAAGCAGGGTDPGMIGIGGTNGAGIIPACGVCVCAGAWGGRAATIGMVGVGAVGAVGVGMGGGAMGG